MKNDERRPRRKKKKIKGACEYEKQQNTETQKTGEYTSSSGFIYVRLATVVAVILVCSPAVDAQYKTVGCMVIDKKNAVIAAMAAVFCGIAGFVIRHHAAR